MDAAWGQVRFQTQAVTSMDLPLIERKKRNHCRVGLQNSVLDLAAFAWPASGSGMSPARATECESGDGHGELLAQWDLQPELG